MATRQNPARRYLPHLGECFAASDELGATRWWFVPHSRWVGRARGHSLHPSMTSGPSPNGTRQPTSRCWSRSILGWKEYELELMRDRNDNVVVVWIENVESVFTQVTPSRSPGTDADRPAIPAGA